MFILDVKKKMNIQFLQQKMIVLCVFLFCCILCESQDSGKQEHNGGTLALTHLRISTKSLSHCYTAFFNSLYWNKPQHSHTHMYSNSTTKVKLGETICS